MEDLALNVMDHEAAVQWKTALGQTAQNLRTLLWEGYHGEAHIALGYTNFTACMNAIAEELDLSLTHLWRLHSANMIEAQLAPGSVGAIPERHLRPLRHLPIEEKQEVWQRVKRAAKGKEITTAQVERIVRQRQAINAKSKGEVSLPPLSDRQRAKRQLLNTLDWLTPELEWTVLHQIWQLLWEATPDGDQGRERLLRIQSFMADLEPSDEEDTAEDIL